ncbi:MAG: nuclear transport factor 2 family protein [Steroidobacteraceae bacterium]
MDAKQLAQEAEIFWREEYSAAFVRKDPVGYANAFALPCLVCAENMGRRVFHTREELVGYCTELIQRARTTGWERSQIDSLTVRVLDNEVATVSVEATRYDSTGTSVARLYGSYALNRESDEWKMATIYGGFLPNGHP